MALSNDFKNGGYFSDDHGQADVVIQQSSFGVEDPEISHGVGSIGKRNSNLDSTLLSASQAQILGLDSSSRPQFKTNDRTVASPKETLTKRTTLSPSTYHATR